MISHSSAYVLNQLALERQGKGKKARVYLRAVKALALGKKTRSAMLRSLQDTPSGKELLVIATGRYQGSAQNQRGLATLAKTLSKQLAVFPSSDSRSNSAVPA